MNSAFGDVQIGSAPPEGSGFWQVEGAVWDWFDLPEKWEFCVKLKGAWSKIRSGSMNWGESTEQRREAIQEGWVMGSVHESVGEYYFLVPFGYFLNCEHLECTSSVSSFLKSSLQLSRDPDKC